MPRSRGSATSSSASGEDGIEILSASWRARLAVLSGRLIPERIVAEVTRDDGATEPEEPDALLLHLGLATVSIVALVWLTIGWRAAAVTAVVIPALYRVLRDPG